MVEKSIKAGGRSSIKPDQLGQMTQQYREARVQQRRQDRKQSKERLEALTGPPKKLLSTLSWKLKLLKTISWQAYDSMKDPNVREFIIEHVDPEIAEFVTAEFPNPKDWDRVMFGCVLKTPVRTQIEKVFEMKRQRATYLGGLRVPQTKVSE